MRHLSEWINPREHGCTPYKITFLRHESGPVPSLLDEGLVYRHPATTETCIVWAQDQADIARVLTSHYGRTWHDLVMHTRETY
jgi:hypothetical protein